MRTAVGRAPSIAELLEAIRRGEREAYRKLLAVLDDLDPIAEAA